MCRKVDTAGRRERGFTLLEVLVATVVLGFGLALSFSAISGAFRLSQRAFEHEAAMQLAQAKLDEVLLSRSYELAEDAREDIYGGTAYGYKIEVRKVPLLAAAYKDKVKLPFSLDEITITVFWGAQGFQQSYSLAAYRFVDDAATPTQGAAPPSGGGQPPSTPPAEVAK